MIRVASEPLSRWYDEAGALFRAHWDEIGMFRDVIDLDVDIARMVTLERAGLWHCWTVRDGQTLVGYCMVLRVPSHLHYKAHAVALVDAIYIAPRYRQVGLRSIGHELIDVMERELPPVTKLIFHVKISLDFGGLLERRGYVCTEKNYEKLMSGSA